jgi:hypothetical protein
MDLSSFVIGAKSDHHELFNEPEKSKESRFWLMASEHSTSRLVDRDTLTL